MKHIRMTTLSRTLALSALLTAPLSAQTARDSALVKAATVAKQTSDSMALLVAPSLTQYCNGGAIGYVKNGACLAFPRLLPRARLADSTLAVILSVPAPRPKPDTIRVTTVRSDTVRITTTVTLHDTVFVLSVTPAVVASVATTVTPLTLAPGQIAQASVVAKDSSGTILTGRAVTWSSAAPSVAVVSNTGVVTAVTPGSAAIKATVDTKSSYRTLTVTAPDTASTSPVDTTRAPPPADTSSVAELPRVYLNTAVSSTPSAGRSLLVHAGGNLQAALDSARSGDKIILDACATYRGNYSIAAKSGGIAGGWITVQSAGQAPVEGSRASPAIAASMCFPKITSATSSYTLSTNGAAARWRFIGLEFTNDASVPTVNGTIGLGSAGSDQNSLSVTPTDIILDRVYIHAPDQTDDRRCISANSARTAVIDSYVSGCKSTFDAQAFAVTNGPGPFKIVNNYLEASGENIAFGGADPGIPGLVPADMEIRRNHFFKPLAWKGTQWVEKNIIESKNSTRVLIEANVLENSWSGGQVGYTLALWSVNQQGGCPRCETSNWTFRNNLIRNVAAGVTLTSGFSAIPSVMPVPMHHITIRNNLWIGITNEYGRIFQLDTISYMTIEHNTAFSPNNSSFLFGNHGTPAATIIRNNLMGGGMYQIFSPWGSGSAAWNGASGGAGAWAGNVVALAPDWLNPIPGTFYPATMDAIGLSGGGAAAYSTSASPDQMALSASSPYKGKGTDGKDPGADIAVIKAAIAGVVQPVAVGARRTRTSKP